jgi:hypothetical protein
MTPTPPEDKLKPSARAIRYGIAIAVVVVGILCGAIIPGTTGGTICTAVVGVGLVAVVSLVFYDVGLTEDRDRERKRQRDERLRRLEDQRTKGPAAHREERRRPERPPPSHRIRDEHGRLR